MFIHRDGSVCEWVTGDETDDVDAMGGAGVAAERVGARDGGEWRCRDEGAMARSDDEMLDVLAVKKSSSRSKSNRGGDGSLSRNSGSSSLRSSSSSTSRLFRSCARFASLKNVWLVLGFVSTGENGVVASGSWEGGTETKAPNSVSGERGESKSGSGGGVSVGDARGVGGENRVANRSIHSSVSFVGEGMSGGIDDAMMTGWPSIHASSLDASVRTFLYSVAINHLSRSRFIELSLSLEVIQRGYTFIRMDAPLLRCPSNGSLSL